MCIIGVPVSVVGGVGERRVLGTPKVTTTR
jgi:hypothetical protein